MTDIVVAAFITGVFGLIGGLAVGYRDEIKNWLARSSRRLEGTWSGQAYDIPVEGHLSYEKTLKYKLQCKFTQTGCNVRAQFTVTSDRTSYVTVRGTIKGEYFVSKYENDDKNTVDWGVGLARFYGTGERFARLLSWQADARRRSRICIYGNTKRIADLPNQSLKLTGEYASSLALSISGPLALLALASLVRLSWLLSLRLAHPGRLRSRSAYPGRSSRLRFSGSDRFALPSL